MLKWSMLYFTPILLGLKELIACSAEGGDEAGEAEEEVHRRVHGPVPGHPQIPGTNIVKHVHCKTYA